MRTSFLKTDADSFRGKLYLLIADKIVIGALIAVVFILYDHWKTSEVRRYDEMRQELDLAFKRAEYVKQLVPVVVDENQDVLFRAQALAALIETQSVSSASAITLGQKVLLADLQGVGSYTATRVNPVNEEVHTFTLSSDTGEDFLLDAMLNIMPEGIDAVLNEYLHTIAQFRELGPDQTTAVANFNQRRRLDNTAGFWIELFARTAAEYPDEQLLLLDSDAFLVARMADLDAIVPSLDRQTAEQWVKRAPRGLRLLGALRLIQRGRTEQSLPPLTEAIDPRVPGQNEALSAEVIKLLHKHAVVSPELAELVLTIVLRREDLPEHRVQPGDDRNPIEDRFYAAAEYLVWLGGFPQVSSRLEPHLIAPIEEFAQELASLPVSAIDRSINRPLERTLLRVLINANSASNEMPSTLSRDALEELFALQEDKLDAANLLHLARSWQERKQRGR